MLSAIGLSVERGPFTGAKAVASREIALTTRNSEFLFQPPLNCAGRGESIAGGAAFPSAAAG